MGGQNAWTGHNCVAIFSGPTTNSISCAILADAFERSLWKCPRLSVAPAPLPETL